MRKLTICGHDVCFYSLVLPKEPSSTQKSAAEFLGRVIRSGCGLTLPVAEDAPLAIRIGTRGAAPEIRWDGFRIDAQDGQVFLDGNLDRGTLYAAFSFAERFLGYRRFTDDLEVIPETGEASVPEGFHALENPGFEGRRTTCYHHVRSGEFSAHHRLNDSLPVPEELGGTVNFPGDCHSFYKLIPADVYFKDHPEYYSLWNGERLPCRDC
ncbi:MAG: hypothetical protein J5494_08170, partial [Candidatus Methanomethylophilaceae archaeon]|nr:hypothetical protein [Candidatus Methanomethylophilaceae archaeon]